MITHFLATPLLRAGRFKDAQELFDSTLQRISQQFIPPEVYAAFLHSKTNLFETWSKSSNVKGNTKQITFLQEQCVATLTEAVECWRKCLQNALPLSQTYIKFKLARALNDLALNLRLIGRISEAEQAIIECIDLKAEREKKEGTLSQSYGISLGEYAQVLAAQGKFERSQNLNREAQIIMDTHIEQGNSRARSNKGMLLVEQAYICFQQANLSEAKHCLNTALKLLEGTTSREEYVEQATNLLTQIEPWLFPTSTHYLLDQHWFERYHQLANYDDLEMLVQAGPFTADEQHSWDILFSHRSEQENRAKLKEIIANSKERELARCSTEGSYVPNLTYSEGTVTITPMKDGHAGKTLDISGLNASIVRQSGLAHIPEDRRGSGLVLTESIEDNTILGRQRWPEFSWRHFALLLTKITTWAVRLVKDFDIRTPSAEVPARALSGGNQQKIIIAREFASNPEALIAAQPTRGVDIGAIEFIHRRLIEQRDAGKAVLLISAELDEIRSLSDRIAVMYEGQIVDIVSPEATEEQLGILMTGGHLEEQPEE